MILDPYFSSSFLMKLVGVYSGRIGVDDENIKAQLGIVWKSDVIDEIISQRITGKNNGDTHRSEKRPPLGKAITPS